MSKVQYVKVGQDYHSLNPPQGESFEKLRQRAEKFKHYVLTFSPKQTILIFSHYAFLQQFHGVLLNIDPYNCLEQEINILEFNFFELDASNQVKTHQEKQPLLELKNRINFAV